MRRVVLLALLALAACTSGLENLRQAKSVDAADARFTVRWSDPDELEPPRVSRALEKAQGPLARWGGLVEPVTIFMVPSHEALERAVGHHGYGWLKAWAQFDSIVVQSPRTWAGHVDSQVDELLLHELTHCALFQHSATATTWTSRKIPLWFREGMATVTANQGYRFPTLEDLATWIREHPQVDVFKDAEALSQTAYEQIYGLAHHAMSFLVKRYGDRAVLATMAEMKRGADFESAFLAATGLGVEAYQRELLNYVRLRGFRGAGLPIHSTHRQLIDEALKKRLVPGGAGDSIPQGGR